MDNIKYLEDNIDQVKELIAETEQQMADGGVLLDAQMYTLKRHLKDLRAQLKGAEAREPELVS